MKILVTGSSGFLGKTILKELKEDELTTLGRDSYSDIVCDLSKATPLITQSYNLIIHAAGQAHITPKTKGEKLIFFDINVTGTQNLLKGLEQAPNLPQYLVFISSVSVYGIEVGHLIGEDTSLFAKDPYGKSKIEAEKILEQWCAKNNVVCTILRLPLLAGPKPPGNLRAMIKGIQKGYYFNIAGGKAKKSIVLSEDVARIIPIVAKIGGTYNLTDRHHPSFHELSNHIAKQLHKSKPLSIPLFVAKLVAIAGDLIGNKAPINSKKLNKIISDLTFNDSKAVKAFSWNPTPVLKGFQIKSLHFPD